MKIFGQIISILPLALVVSLPNQLFAHVPITNISSQFTEYLERADAEDLEDEDEEDEDDKPEKEGLPELSDIFAVGQYVRSVVTAVHAPGATDNSGIGKSRDEISRASKRVELSLVPEAVNTGVAKSDLKAGFVSAHFVNVNIFSKELTYMTDLDSIGQESRRSWVYS